MNDATQAKQVQQTVSLTAAAAQDLAQFLKRVGFSEFRANAVDEVDAYPMRDAADKVAPALAGRGFAPGKPESPKSRKLTFSC